MSKFFANLKTIENYEQQGRDNNYNLLRFLAAACVIFAHSYYLSKNGPEPLQALTGYLHMGEFGVNIFFVISGFLITKSYLSRGNLAKFLEARLLRIYPALIVSILFAVFVLGPWATTLSVGDYLKHPLTQHHLLNNMTLNKIVYVLPGVFNDNLYPRAVNGSLWSLYPEVRLYLFVAVFGLFGLLGKKKVFNVALTLSVVLFFFFPQYFPLLSQNSIYWMPASFFALGAFCYINRRFIPLYPVIFVGLVLLAVLLRGHAFFPRLFDLATIYGVFVVAYVPVGFIRKFNQLGDYSYGLYIYAFPMQQSVSHVLHKMSAMSMLLYSFLLTLSLAILSWHFIEKPSLSLKGKLGHYINPRRLFRSQKR